MLAFPAFEAQKSEDNQVSLVYIARSCITLKEEERRKEEAVD